MVPLREHSFMFHFFPVRRVEIHFPLRKAIALPFLLGVLFGCLIGLFSSLPEELLSSVGLMASGDGTTFIQALWHAARFVLAAALCATGILGVFFLPLLSALRGFLLACSAAAVYQSGIHAAVWISLFTFCIPALFELPAFFLTASNAFSFSTDLTLHGVTHAVQEFSLFQIICISAAFLIICALYSAFLLPVLLRALS